jgi:hypothetical protein
VVGPLVRTLSHWQLMIVETTDNLLVIAGLLYLAAFVLTPRASRVLRGA